MRTGGTDSVFEGKRILITGGTGSLGSTLARRLLTGELGRPERIVIFSRDEAKQHLMRTQLQQQAAASEDLKYVDAFSQLTFRIGDVRDYSALCTAMRGIDVVIHAAALKQVPVCEYQPTEAVATNVQGARNIVQAIMEQQLPIDTVIGISTDKACQPVNVMGLTKSLQERILLSAGLRCPETRFVVTRYGNVLASRGSVIPHFHDQIRRGGPVTVTVPTMTRFVIGLDQAVQVIADAHALGVTGDVVVPRLPSARVIDIASALIGERPVSIEEIGIRPGEKIHELLVAEDEAERAYCRDQYVIIRSSLPELHAERSRPADALPLDGAYTSADDVLSPRGVVGLLDRHQLLLDDAPDFPATFLYGVDDGRSA